MLLGRQPEQQGRYAPWAVIVDMKRIKSTTARAAMQLQTGRVRRDLGAMRRDARPTPSRDRTARMMHAPHAGHGLVLWCPRQACAQDV